MTAEGGDATMTDPRNRIRQARRHGNLSQQALAERVGVHRSAVAQWEQPGGSHPTMENLARIAISTGVSFEWLATGRGRMQFVSDLVASDAASAAMCPPTYPVPPMMTIRAMMFLSFDGRCRRMERDRARAHSPVAFVSRGNPLVASDPAIRVVTPLRARPCGSRRCRAGDASRSRQRP